LSGRNLMFIQHQSDLKFEIALMLIESSINKKSKDFTAVL